MSIHFQLSQAKRRAREALRLYRATWSPSVGGEYLRALRDIHRLEQLIKGGVS
jgi:hypothetical protein